MKRNGVLVVFILCVCFISDAASQNFVERPSHVTVREGQTALFRCIIRNLQSMQRVYWARPSMFLTNNRDVLNVPQRNRLSVIGNANLGEYFLRIRNTVASDAGTYRCGYAIPNGRFTFQRAELTVQRPPDPGFPLCEVSPSTVDIGVLATLTCRSDGGIPPASLTWNADGRALTEPIESRNVLSVVLSAEKNGLEFICKAASPVIDEPRMCSVTPLSIPPDVRIEPPLRIAEVGGRAVFTCIAFGLPEIVRYEWKFDNEPVNGIDRIAISGDERTLTISNLRLFDNETPVHCTAITTNGLSATSGALLRVVEPGNFTTEPTTIDITTAFGNDTMIANPGKPSGIIIAIIVIAVIVGQVLIIILVYILHRYANKMMKERRERRRPQPMRKQSDMGENIYVRGVSLNETSPEIDPETGSPVIRCPNEPCDDSFSLSMGEGIYNQTPGDSTYNDPPVTHSPTQEGSSGNNLPAKTPSVPIYNNAEELKEETSGHQSPLSAPPLSPPSDSESHYGYTEVPFVETLEVPRRPPPPTNTPPRPPVVITSPPPSKIPPRLPADKRQSGQGQCSVQPNHPYCGLNPNRPDSQYLSLRHYDDVYAEQALEEGARLNGETYSPNYQLNDDEDIHHDDDGYIYELPPTNSTKDEVYDIPPDAEKREYTFMGSIAVPK